MTQNVEINREIEVICGITEYTTNTPSISGIIKKYPSDFIVLEVLKNGEETNISNLDNTNPSDFSEKVKFTSFDLVKMNWDTILIAERIARALKIDYTQVSWAGLKDNNAITVQRMCVKGNHYKTLKNLKIQDVKFKNFAPRSRKFKLGDLWGNKFNIIIRNIELLLENPSDAENNEGLKNPINPEIPKNSINQENPKNKSNQQKDKISLEKAIQDCETQLNQHGFPNYYGLQRFGSFRPNSHIVGKFLYLEEYENAVEEFLIKTYPFEKEYVRLIREELKEKRNYEQAMEKFPNSLHYEKRMLKSLTEHPYNYKRAIEQLPYPLRNLLLSSYQSYLFNLAISKRLENVKTINEPQENDIIGILHDPNGPHSKVFYKYTEKHKKSLDRALELNRATILCPIVGYESNITNNPFEPIYDEIFKKENFSQEKFKFTGFKAFDFKGNYRPIYIKPKNLTSKLVTLKEHKHKIPCLELEFALPKGSYATMLLREFCKT